MTLSAHMDATLLQLCKAYDLYDGKPTLNLRNFLETIQANLYLFDEPNFRERLKENAFVDSLAAAPSEAQPDVTSERPGISEQCRPIGEDTDHLAAQLPGASQSHKRS
jgi:hypothetical protein